MSFQEYPKSLYRKGEHLIVTGADEEDAASDEGWTDWHSDVASLNEPDEQKAADRQSLQKECQDAGIAFDARWGVAKLREALGK